MLKQHIIKPLAFLVAFMLLVAPAGLAIDVHLCKGNIKAISFFGTAQKCTINDVVVTQCLTTPKKVENTPQISKTPCCANHSYFSKADISPISSSAGKTITHCVAVVQTCANTLVLPITVYSQAKNSTFSPPDLFSQKISVLYQTFRI